MQEQYQQKDLQRQLKKLLSKKRYLHSKAVEKRAVELAARFSPEDCERAAVAGLMHDVCKDMSEKQQLALIARGNIVLDPVSVRSPQVLHAPAGSAWLQRELKLQDGEILNAVRYHTTGRGGMSVFEKIIYLADLTSEDRDYPDFAYTKSLCDKNLDAGMLYALAYTISSMVQKRQPVCPDTLEAYNQFLLDALPGASGL